MASAGWDQVLGGGDGADDGPPAPPKKTRVKTSTKVGLVVGGWLLLTLFLVGRFSADKPQPSAVAQLDAVAGADGVGADEDFEPEPVDTEEEELLDVDGDGFLSAEEQGIVEGEAAAAVEGGAGVPGSGGTYEGTAAGSAAGGDSGSSSGNAVPGSAPSGGGSTGGGGSAGATSSTSSTTTTTTTTTTTAGSGGTGGSGGSGGGGGTPSSTKATTTTTTTSTTAAPGKYNVTIVGNMEANFAFSPNSFSIPAGTKVIVANPSNKDHVWKVEGRAADTVKKDESVENVYSTPGRYSFSCTVTGHIAMTGSFTVT